MSVKFCGFDVKIVPDVTHRIEGYELLEIKAELERLRAEVEKCKSKKCSHKKCHHKIIQMGTYGMCEICGKYSGWYCPDSESHICDYTQDVGGKRIYLRMVDCCRYCGEPEERK